MKLDIRGGKELIYSILKGYQWNKSWVFIPTEKLLIAKTQLHISYPIDLQSFVFS